MDNKLLQQAEAKAAAAAAAAAVANHCTARRKEEVEEEIFSSYLNLVHNQSFFLPYAETPPRTI